MRNLRPSATRPPRVSNLPRALCNLRPSATRQQPAVSYPPSARQQPLPVSYPSATYLLIYLSTPPPPSPLLGSATSRPSPTRPALVSNLRRVSNLCSSDTRCMRIQNLCPSDTIYLSIHPLLSSGPPSARQQPPPVSYPPRGDRGSANLESPEISTKQSPKAQKHPKTRSSSVAPRAARCSATHTTRQPLAS